MNLTEEQKKYFAIRAAAMQTAMTEILRKYQNEVIQRAQQLIDEAELKDKENETTQLP